MEPLLDEAWELLGRVLVPSCNQGECYLHMQARQASWAAGHFHVGRVPITPVAGLELTGTMLSPPDPSLVKESLDTEEAQHDIVYLAMVKLLKPADTIAFATVNGLTILITSTGLSALFGPSEKCKHCTAQHAYVPGPSTVEMAEFDPLMEMLVGNEKNH